MPVTTSQQWLVEIRVKDWIHVPDGESRIVTFEEVLASDEFAALHAAFDQFERRCHYEPLMRQKMQRRKLTIPDCCAPDAVALT